MNGVSVGRVERQRNHAFNLRKINADCHIVICRLAGLELFVFLGSCVRCVEVFHRFVRLPDRGQAGGFRCHNVNADSEIHAQILHARADKFKNLVGNKSVLEDFAAKSNRNVVRTYTLFRCVFKVNQNDFRGFYVPRVFQKLFNKLRTAFADAHGTHSAVTGVAVRAKNHLTAAGHHFSCILMNNRLICRNVNSAVLDCRRKTENVVVLVDCAADRAKAVVAVGQRIGNREFCKSACSCGLNDADVGDVVRNEGVELNLHPVFVFTGVVGVEYAVCDGVVSCAGGDAHGSKLRLLFGFASVNKCSSVYKVNAVIDNLHSDNLLILSSSVKTVDFFVIVLVKLSECVRAQAE